MGELLTLLLPFSLPSARSQDYGGYLSTYILPAKGENQGPVFTCGSALSPITDFKLYGRGPDRRGAGPTQPPAPRPPSLSAQSDNDNLQGGEARGGTSQTGPGGGGRGVHATCSESGQCCPSVAFPTHETRSQKTPSACACSDGSGASRREGDSGPPSPLLSDPAVRRGPCAVSLSGAGCLGALGAGEGLGELLHRGLGGSAPPSAPAPASSFLRPDSQCGGQTPPAAARTWLCGHCWGGPPSGQPASFL